MNVLIYVSTVLGRIVPESLNRICWKGLTVLNPVIYDIG